MDSVAAKWRRNIQDVHEETVDTWAVLAQSLLLYIQYFKYFYILHYLLRAVVCVRACLCKAMILKPGNSGLQRQKWISDSWPGGSYFSSYLVLFLNWKPSESEAHLTRKTQKASVTVTTAYIYVILIHFLTLLSLYSWTLFQIWVVKKNFIMLALIFYTVDVDFVQNSIYLNYLLKCITVDLCYVAPPIIYWSTFFPQRYGCFVDIH